MECVVVKHSSSYIEGKAESHFAEATTVSETGCVSLLVANHGPDRAPQLATYSGGYSSRYIGFVSLPLFTCPGVSLEQP